MDLPSTRELELEALVRQRDGQVSELNDEITRLRQYIANQPGPPATDPVTLPPPLMNILLPHIRNASQAAAPGSSTVLNALTQRVRLLQEENDELYQILKVKETGKLKEEVRGLRRVVHRLEGSLRESHQVIDALSTELEKVYDTLMASSKQIPSAQNPQHHSPRSSHHTPGPSQPSGTGKNGGSRGLPTEPRAFKKPRLSDSRQSPPEAPHHPLPPNPRTNAISSLPLPLHRGQQQGYNNANTHSRAGNAREQKLSGGGFHKSNSRTVKMDIDEESTATRKDRGRERGRESALLLPSDRERDTPRNNPKDRGDNDKERRDRGMRDRERGGGNGNGRDGRDKDSSNTAANSGRGPPPRRNGVFQGNLGRGGHGGGPGRRNNNSERGPNAPTNGQTQATIDRSLAERMGF